MLTDEDIYIVKKSVSMRSLAEMLGFKVSRAGFITCPFHTGDRTGSLKVYSQDRGFYCYGCNASGNIFQFVMRHTGMGFEQAVRYIAGLYTIRLSDEKGLTKEEYRASAQRIADRKAQAEKAMQERNEKHDRLTEVANLMRKCQRLQKNFDPLGTVWCRLQIRYEKLENEWAGLFEDLYGDEKRSHTLTGLVGVRKTS